MNYSAAVAHLVESMTVSNRRATTSGLRSANDRSGPIPAPIFEPPAPPAPPAFLVQDILDEVTIAARLELEAAEEEVTADPDDDGCSWHGTYISMGVDVPMPEQLERDDEDGPWDD